MNYPRQKIRKYIAAILSLPYLSKKIVFMVDIVLIAIIFTISSFIFYNLTVMATSFMSFLKELILCVVINGISFSIFSTYKGILRYSSFKDSLRIFLSLLCSNIALGLIIVLFLEEYSTLLLVQIFINFVLGFSTIVLYRMMIRLFFDYVKTIFTSKKYLPLLILGTKLTHISLAKMIRDNEYLPYSIAGFISLESNRTNHKILNYPIYRKADFLTNASLFQHIRALLIISEELDSIEKQLLVEKCMEYKIELLSAPSLDDWKTKEKKVHKIDKVRIEDLLGRGQININIESIGSDLKGKTILITGAAGSIGSEIVLQLCRFDVKTLLLCDIAETPLHQLNLELNDRFPNVKKQLLIADVRNYERMKSVFEKYRPQFIYHAAAYKHVPLMEEHPAEAILANVMGTKNVADLAVNYQAECFVMISTDKAVNPSNVMGASKRIAEIYIQCLVHQRIDNATESSPRFITTRFGNVLGSNGSVIPLFAKQIEAGGPITVTHPEIIRYFMTISEACNLVLEAGSLGKGGEIFVFDMGKSVKIKEMAESMIRLSGLRPYIDINIVYTGLRPGEKLYEELMYDEEKTQPTHHEKIMVSKVIECNYGEIMPLLSRLIVTAERDNNIEIVKLMKEIVPEYISQNSVYSILDDDN